MGRAVRRCRAEREEGKEMRAGTIDHQSGVERRSIDVLGVVFIEVLGIVWFSLVVKNMENTNLRRGY
jgi:hypothetical protein